MIIAIHFLTPLGSIFFVLMLLYVYEAKIQLFLIFGIFFSSEGHARGERGRRRRRRRRRGTAARGGHGHGRRAEDCAWEEGGRAHGPPRETAQRAADAAPLRPLTQEVIFFNIKSRSAEGDIEHFGRHVIFRLPLRCRPWSH